MPTLILSSRSVVYDRALADSAISAGWQVIACDRDTLPTECADPVVYVSTDLALEASRRLNLALLEPPFDLLARIPDRFRRRVVEFARFADLAQLRRPTFVKPADPLDKWFDAGVYADVRDIRTKGVNRPDAPVLLSEPVEWSAEYRCFVLDERIIAGSPYLSFGRPIWKPHGHGRVASVPKPGLAVVEALCTAMRHQLPPAFVVDVGPIESRGWAVVEFNPIWCAGLLGADPEAVLPALRPATRSRETVAEAERRWVAERGEKSHG